MATLILTVIATMRFAASDSEAREGAGATESFPVKTEMGITVFVTIREKAPGICLAAARGNLPLAKAFVGQGVSLETRDEDGRTPLALAALTSHCDIVEFLLAKGADPTAEDSIHGTPLHSAADVGSERAVLLLLASKAPVNKQDDLGFTPLMLAAQNGFTAIARRLLAAGAAVDVTDIWEHKTAEWWAWRNNHIELAHILKERSSSQKATGVRSDYRQ